MTCIVGLAYAGDVLIGGDSASSDGYTVGIVHQPKVFWRSGYAIGYTTSFRFGQLVEHAELPTPPEGESLYAHMVGAFVGALRTVLKDGGFATVDRNVETGGRLLVGVRGQLFSVESDFGVLRQALWYNAVGSGATFALGAMHASRARAPVGVLLDGLRAAAQLNNGVRPPFSFVRASDGLRFQVER